MTAIAQPKPALRPFLPADAPLLAEIFRASVEELTADDYSDAQREAWAATADDPESFAERLERQVTLLGTLGGSPVGFVSLKDGNCIDMLYVHPAAAGQGIGAMLIDAIERIAAARGTETLSAEVSDTALPFFQQRQFVAWRRNSVPLGTEWLSNTTMRKTLATAKQKP
jgi:putative acetyltransferase